METWAQIKRYSGLYEISSFGRVKSLPRKKIVKKVGFYITKEKMLKYKPVNYPHVTLTDSIGKKRTELIHRLVAEAFIPNPENKPEVNHINSNPKDFSISNLEWVTKSENGIHAYKFGGKRWLKGELHPLAKLSDVEVLEIREKYKSGNYRYKDLANEYKSSIMTIGRIIRNELRIL